MLVKCFSPKKTDYRVYTCFTNLAIAEIYDIDIQFSGDNHKIKLLKPSEKVCLSLPWHGDASYSLNLCMGDEVFSVQEVGYFWKVDDIDSSEKKINVDIFLDDNYMVMNILNAKFVDGFSRYKNMGKCKKKPKP